jgi:release factor glutamine methyltransferase
LRQLCEKIRWKKLHALPLFRPSEMKTVLEIINSTAAYFQKNGVESARLNAEHLLAHRLGCKRLDLYMQFDRPLGEPELEPLREQVKKRAQGVPLQHLLGTVEFFGQTFLCDARALVPRPETEQLVELLMAKCKVLNANFRALDVGTGSGVIALSLAKAFSESEIHAVDVSPDALALARENAARLGLPERVHFSQGDLFEKLGEEKFDLIVANLPYISAGVIASLAREVQHDPRLALDGGARGDEILLRFIADATTHFSPAGTLALEIGHDQAARLADELARNGYHDIEIKNDHQGIARFLFAKYG